MPSACFCSRANVLIDTVLQADYKETIGNYLTRDRGEASEFDCSVNGRLSLDNF